MIIDPMSAAALRDAVRRELLPDLLRAVEAGLAPTVIGIHRSGGGVTVELDRGDGVVVAREVRLDPDVFDLRIRLAIVERAIYVLVADAQRLPVAVGPVPLTRGVRP